MRKSGAEGSALKEAQAINKSLSALGDVIHARLAKAAHVPFRNSTLTYLLQDSLSGDAKVLMLVCVSPALANAEESSATLRFAERVRNVELGKASKQVVAVAPAAVAVAPPALSLDGSSGSSGFSSCDSEGPPLFSPLQQQQQQRKPPSPAINRGPRRSNA